MKKMILIAVLAGTQVCTAEEPRVANALSDISGAWKQTTETREKISLNGMWEVWPYLDGEAVTETIPAAEWGRGKVPSIWPGADFKAQRFAFTGSRTNAAQFVSAWFRRDLAVPKSAAGRRVAVEFTMINTRATVFVDGVKAGTCFYPDGEVEITRQVKPGAQQSLAILVETPPKSEWTTEFSDRDRAVTKKSSVKIKGITGDLYLNITPKAARLGDVWTGYAEDGTVTFHARTAGADAGASYRLKMTLMDKHKKTRAFTSGVLTPDAHGELVFAATFADALRWDLDTPDNRYIVWATLLDADGKLIDAATPFKTGFRTFTIAGRDFKLNGSTVHLRTMMSQCANSDADVASLDWARETCRRMKTIGCNHAIQYHYSCAPGSVGYLDGILEACDREGILLSVTLPHARAYVSYPKTFDDPAARADYMKDVEWFVNRVRNHPCVVSYAANHNMTGSWHAFDPLAIARCEEYKADENPAHWAEMPGWKREIHYPHTVVKQAWKLIKEIDPDHVAYNHQAGALGDVYTLNMYQNMAPLQEREDWIEEWARRGTMPLVFVEYGMPHQPTFSSERVKFVWSTPSRHYLRLNEYNAIYHGDAAYGVEMPEMWALYRKEDKELATGEVFRFTPWFGMVPKKTTDFMAMFARRTWPALRTHGISGVLAWDFDLLFKRVEGKNYKAEDYAKRQEGLEKPGIVPDVMRGQPFHSFIHATCPRDYWEPTSLGRAFYRWNMPDLGYIGGRAGDSFTEHSHTFRPGETIEKTLVVVNDRRKAQRVKWKWLARAEPGHQEQEGVVAVGPGEVARVPVAFTGAAGAVTLAAEFEFEGGEKQSDEMKFQCVAPEKRHTRTVALYDPKGLTRKEFARLGIECTAWQPGAAVPTETTLVVGREGLDEAAFKAVTAAADAGARVVVMEQSKATLETLLGFRVHEVGARKFFKSSKHPLFAGLDDALLCDWRGKSTLIPPYYPDYPDYTWVERRMWAGFNLERPYRAGNRGCVATVLPEIPGTGDWMPYLRGEFDLQYSPLMEWRRGKGGIIFSQLDFAGRSAAEPVADDLVLRVLALAEEALPARKRVRALGAQAAELCRREGVVTTDGDAEIWVVSSGAAVPADYLEKVRGGLTVVALGLNEKEAPQWAPKPVTAETRWEWIYSHIKSIPAEFDGALNADWSWHGLVTFTEIKGDAPGHNGLRVYRSGEGKVIFMQVPPWMLTAPLRTNQRSSFRRASFLFARILGNVGAVFDSAAPRYADTPIAEDDPYRYFHW